MVDDGAHVYIQLSSREVPALFEVLPTAAPRRSTTASAATRAGSSSTGSSSPPASFCAPTAANPPPPSSASPTVERRDHDYSQTDRLQTDVSRACRAGARSGPPALPPITRVNSRILYAAAIFGFIVIWVVTFTVTSRHPQTKPPAPPQVQDAAPNLDSLASLAERLRVAQEMQKKLAAAARAAGAVRSLPRLRRDTRTKGSSSEPGRPANAFGSAAPEPPPSLPSATPRRRRGASSQPSPGKTRFEQALAAPPLVAPAGSAPRSGGRPSRKPPIRRPSGPVDGAPDAG